MKGCCYPSPSRRPWRAGRAPTQARASWLSEAVHNVLGDQPVYYYSPPAYDYGYYTPSYVYPVRAYDDDYYYTPGVYWHGGRYRHGGRYLRGGGRWHRR